LASITPENCEYGKARVAGEANILGDQAGTVRLIIQPDAARRRFDRLRGMDSL